MNIQAFTILLLTTTLSNADLAQASIQLGFSPAAQTGNTLSVGIVISGLAEDAAPALATYDFNLQFDANQLAFTGASFGDSILGNQLDLFNLGENAASANLIDTGVLNVFELSLDSAADLNNLQADSFTLATFSFFVLSSGNSLLNLTLNTLADANGEPLDADISPAAPITTVPLPSAFLMLFTGLAGLIFTAANSSSARITLR